MSNSELHPAFDMQKDSRAPAVELLILKDAYLDRAILADAELVEVQNFIEKLLVEYQNASTEERVKIAETIRAMQATMNRVAVEAIRINDRIDEFEAMDKSFVSAPGGVIGEA